MRKTNKWFILLCSVIIMALLLPTAAMAVPADAPDAAAADDASTEPAQPVTFTTDDGVMSLILPDDSWKQLNDENNWLSLSSGTDHIFVDHLSNGEQLPNMVIADDIEVQVFQVIYSTQNEIFIITGTVEEPQCMEDVRTIIESFRILQFDTKQAVTQPENPEQPEEPTFGLREIGETMYCTTEDGVHVRAGCSTDDSIIGGIGYADAVYVNGMVTKDGEDYGWLQIQYGDSVGYVWYEFFDANQPQPLDPTPTDNGFYVYASSGGNRDIFEFSDGTYRSYDGSILFLEDENGAWAGSDGSLYWNSPFNPNMVPYATGDERTVYATDGSAVTLYIFSDGSWRDDMNDLYTPTSTGVVDGPHGFIFYENPDDVPSEPGPLLRSDDDIDSSNYDSIDNDSDDAFVGNAFDDAEDD